MERSPYTPMTPSDQAPNPLRPYYRPPSIGTSTGAPNGASSGFVESKASVLPANRPLPSFGSSARGILSDLNYGDILGENPASTTENIRALLDQAMWKYSSVFMAQPFEVAKMVLQVRAGQQISGISGKDALRQQRIPRQEYRRSSHDQMNDGYNEAEYYNYDDGDDDDDDDDQMSYFTSATPKDPSVSSPSPTPRRRSQQKPPPTAPAPSSRPPVYQLDLRRPDSLLEVIGQLWTREGAWGIWKGTNVTFLHNILQKTLESWLRGLLSALCNLPDPGIVVSSSGVGGLDILDSPSPLSSLAITVVAAGAAGLILSPLDTVRTRVMVTTTVEPPRSIIPCLRALPSWTCPPSLLVPTFLHSTLPTLISTSTPLFLRSNLRIDPIITPTYYSLATFFSSITELFLKLPIETVLRRAQIAYIDNPKRQKPSSSGKPLRSAGSSSSRADNLPLPTVVEVGPYIGVFPTMWRIAREEGESLVHTGSSGSGRTAAAKKPIYAPRRGQGVHGLWQGWRVGVWGIVGVWGAAAMGAASEGRSGEF